MQSKKSSQKYVKIVGSLMGLIMLDLHHGRIITVRDMKGAWIGRMDLEHALDQLVAINLVL